MPRKKSPSSESKASAAPRRKTPGEKLWYMPLHLADWLSDPAVIALSPASRAVWLDALCRMWQQGQTGELSGPVDGLAVQCRVTPSVMRAAISEFKTHDVCDVTERHAVVTLVNRRMSRECHKREAAAERQRKSRKNRKNGGREPPDTSGCHARRHAEVTPASRPIDRDRDKPSPQPPAADGGRPGGEGGGAAPRPEPEPAEPRPARTLRDALRGDRRRKSA